MASRTEMLEIVKRVKILIKNEFALLEDKKGLVATFEIKRVATNVNKSAIA